MVTSRSPGGGAPKAALAQLVQQFGLIIAQAEDSGSQSQHAENLSRLRSVLLTLLDVGAASSTASTRELGGVLRLLNFALDKVPDLLSGEGSALLLEVLSRLVPMLVRQLPAAVASDLGTAVKRALARVAATDDAQFMALLRNFSDLLEDTNAVAVVLSMDPSNSAAIKCCMGSSLDAPESAQQTLLLPLDATAACERLLRALLSVLAAMLVERPLIVAAALPTNVLTAACSLLSSSSIPLQADAMHFLAAVLHAAPCLPLLLRCLPRVLPLVLSTAASQHAAAEAGAREEWWAQLTRLLHSLVEHSSASGDNGSARHQLAQLAIEAARRAPGGSPAQDSICQLFAELVAVQPEILVHSSWQLHLVTECNRPSRQALLGAAALFMRRLPAERAQRAFQEAGISAPPTAEGAVSQLHPPPESEDQAPRLPKRPRLRQPQQAQQEGAAPDADVPAEAAAMAACEAGAKAVATALVAAAAELKQRLGPGVAGVRAPAGAALAEVIAAVAAAAPLAAYELAAAALGVWPNVSGDLTAEQLQDRDELSSLLQLVSAGLQAWLQRPGGGNAAPPTSLLRPLQAVLEAAVTAGGEAAVHAVCTAVLAAQADLLGTAALSSLMEGVLEGEQSPAKVAAATLLPVAACIASAGDTSAHGRGSQGGSRKHRGTALPPANPFASPLQSAVASKDAHALNAVVCGLSLVLGLSHRPAELVVQAAAAARSGSAAPCNPLPDAQPTLPPSASEWMRAALEALCALPELAGATRAALVHAVCSFLRHGSLGQMEHSGRLAQWVVRQAGCKCAAARDAALRHGSLLTRTQFLLTLLHEGPHPIHTRDRQAAAERLEQAAIKAINVQLQAEGVEVAAAETLLQLVGHAGSRVVSHMGQLMAVAILVGFLVHKEQALAAVAARGLEGMASLTQCDVRGLIFRDPALLQHVGKQLPSKPDLLRELAELLGMKRRALATALLPHALPALFATLDRPGVEAMAAYAGLEPTRMMFDYGHHALAKALLKDEPHMSEFMPMVEAVCGGQDFMRFAAAVLPRTTTELVVQTGATEEWGRGPSVPEAAVRRTSEVLALLASTADKSRQEDCAMGAGGMATAEFLADGDHVTRMLKELGDQLDQKLPAAQAAHADASDIAKALQVLRCVLVLVRLTGPFVGRFLPQLMVLLGAAVRPANPPALKLQGLEGWLLLVRALAADAPVQLGGVVNQVVVALLESLQEGGAVCAAAAHVVEELIAVCRRNYKHKLRSMPPLPQWPAELRHVTGLLAEERGKLAVQEHVELLLESLGDESASVRSTALQELRSLLAGRREWLLSLQEAQAPTSTAAGGAPGLLHRLVGALLKCCEPEAANVASAAAQQACAECLGMLGAVDPSRVHIDHPPAAPMCEILGEQDDGLVVSVLTKHLVRLLKTAPNLQTLDAATFAIQEILRSYSSVGLKAFRVAAKQAGNKDAVVPDGNALFASLPEEVRAIVRPYLDSKYSVRGGGVRPKGVVFTPAVSFRRWLALWLTQLIEHHGSGGRLPLFKAAIPVLRFDIPLAMFLAPYVVHNVVAAGGGAAAGVAAEIEAVLKAEASSRDGVLCLQAVFTLLDTLQRWREAAKKSPASAVSFGTTSSRSSGESQEPEWEQVGDLLASIPKEALAQAAARCGAHARALLYFETHVRAVRNGGANITAHRSAQFSDAEVTFLQEVYSRLEEPDGLDGFMKLRRGGPRPEDQRLAAEKAGSWAEALTLYERDLAGSGSGSGNSAGTSAAGLLAAAALLGGRGDGDSGGEGLPASQMGHLNCLLQLGHWQGLLTQVRGLAAEAGGGGGGCGATAAAQLAAMGTAAAWRLGQWAQLDAHLAAAEAGFKSLDPDARWEVRIGRLLRAAAAADGEALRRELESARAEVMGPFSAAAMESYTRAYPQMVKLHMLQEVADVAALLPKCQVGPKDRRRLLRWPERLSLTQASLTTQAPVLALRRQLASLSGAPAEAGQCWLQHAHLCRATGHYDAAAAAVLEAAAGQVPGSALERVELLYARGVHHRAITELSALESLLAEGGGNLHGFATEAECGRHRARVLLKLAQWAAAAGQGGRDEITGMFESALALQPGWETGLFRYATYLDQLMQDARKRQEAGGAAAVGSTNRKDDRLGGASRIKLGEDRHHLEFLPEVVKNYGRSVETGSAHIYRSLPRLLTLWFEFGASPASTSTAAAARKVAEAVQDLMRTFSKGLPLHCWLTALPQLISRVCHPHPEVATVTRHVIIRLTEAYPQQAMWALAAVSKSTVTGRRAAANNIIAAAKRAATSNDARRVFVEIGTFNEQLIKLCHHQPPKKTVSARKEYGHLVRTMPLAVMVPTMAALTVNLPPAGAGAARDWRPFADVVTIAGLLDEVEVMSSMQKPKKITLLGSDGREYPFLAKPKDDLRKDNRMMEVAGVLNRLFQEEPASRRRNLYLRRFSVVPITEDCGILEWVAATKPMRHCIQDTLVAERVVLDKNMANATVKAKYDAAVGPGLDASKASLAKLVAWQEWVLASFPPKFHRWFLGQFPEPAAWLNARLAFTRTYAVWCMVGHVVGGLGDRHGENILVDFSSGDALHIDFGCLFDKGLTLAQPEMVPFRLTHNVVDAFGVAGVEGVFRRSCEITLGVLRSHADTILSVMDTFVHDPLVEWANREGRARGGGDQGGEGGENPHARDALATIEGRLKGTLLGVSSRPCMPLSVEGHTHRLILEAASKENLARMYIWWQTWF